MLRIHKPGDGVRSERGNWECPTCGSTDIKKVSAVFSQGLATASSGVEAATLTAELLAPPAVFPKPRPATYTLFGVVAALFNTSAHQERSKLYNLKQHAHEETQRTLDHRYQRWNRAFFCDRCDTVFDPATRLSFPSSQAASLWDQE